MIRISFGGQKFGRGFGYQQLLGDLSLNLIMQIRHSLIDRHSTERSWNWGTMVIRPMHCMVCLSTSKLFPVYMIMLFGDRGLRAWAAGWVLNLTVKWMGTKS